MMTSALPQLQCGPLPETLWVFVEASRIHTCPLHGKDAQGHQTLVHRKLVEGVLLPSLLERQSFVEGMTTKLVLSSLQPATWCYKFYRQFWYPLVAVLSCLL